MYLVFSGEMLKKRKQENPGLSKIYIIIMLKKKKKR